MPINVLICLEVLRFGQFLTSIKTLGIEIAELNALTAMYVVVRYVWDKGCIYTCVIN